MIIAAAEAEFSLIIEIRVSAAVAGVAGKVSVAIDSKDFLETIRTRIEVGGVGACSVV